MDFDDADAVLAIYQEGLDTGLASFETGAPIWPVWDQKHLDHPRLVFQAQCIIGWAALSPTSERFVYQGVAATSVYVGEQSQGQGIGGQLMRAVAEESEANGIWTLQASIFPENATSVRLHLRHGFRIVGTREKIALLDGGWRDTLLLERRSHEVKT